MKENNYFRNKFVSLLLAVCMVLGLVVLPTGLDENNHVHAESATATEHNCALGGSEFTQEMIDAFVEAGAIDCGSYDFAEGGPLCLYATSDIHWEGEVDLPDGAFIALCTAGHEYSQGTINKLGKGGVYLIDCSVITAEHKDCQAFPDNSITYVTQGYIDLMIDYFECYGEGDSLFGGDSYIALAEDVVFDSALALPPDESTLNVCTNGYTLTWANGIDPTKAAGTVNVIDCSKMPNLVHTCNVAQDRTTALTQDSLTEKLAAVTAGNVTFMHLAENITFEGSISVPEGAYLAICLNGFTLTGKVDNSGNENGGIFLYTCNSDHVCAINGETLGGINLTQQIVDFAETYATEQGQIMTGVFALAEDVTLSSECWLPDSGSELIICRNGHKLTDNVGLNLAEGYVYYIDCNKNTMGDIVHESPMFGESFPMSQETLNDLEEALAPILVESSIYAYNYRYWSIVGSDGQLWYMPYNVSINADGTITAVNTDEYGVATDFCLTNVYDDSGSYLGFAYQLYVPDPNNSSTRYQRYIDIVPVLDADGVSTGEVTLAFTDKTPEAIFSQSSTYNTYTAKVDGVEYFLGSPDGSGVIAAVPVSKLSEGGKPFGNNYYDYRFNGEDGLFIFHLTEDISWEGTLTVPEMNGIVILTNGHTATGEYTHGDTGGVYIFDDSPHVCTATGEGEPIMTVSRDFIELMLVMSGGEVEMEDEQYVALGEDITSLDPRFTITAGSTLYICKNGHTLSDEVYAQLTVNGGRLVYIDCSALNHDDCGKIGEHSPEAANTYLFKNYYQDSDGIFALGAGTYYIYLTSSVKLEKTLVIPAGVELHICLNGFNITSPVINTPDVSGNITGEPCYGAIEVQPGASLTVYDCSAEQTGVIEVNTADDMQGVGGLAAYAVLNNGTFVLNSGNLFGMMALLNSGDATVNDGRVVGVLVAIAQSSELSDTVGGTPSSGEASITVNGGTVSSAAVGIVGITGDITVTGGTINAGFTGVGNSLDSSTTTSGADISLSGCEINVGVADVESFEAVGVATEEGYFDDMSSDTVVGVIASEKLSVDDDVVINVSEKAEQSAETTGDIMLGVNSEATITEVNGEVVGTPYKVIGDGDGDIPKISASADAIEPEEGFVVETNSENEVVIVPIESTAIMPGRTVSMKGIIQLNLFFSLTESFVNNENARICITYKGVSTEYKVSDAKKSGSYYVISIGVSAKDYCENATVTFTDGTLTWGEKATCVDDYFLEILNDNEGNYDSAKEVVSYMQNYCMTAATHFLSADYSPSEEIQTAMNAIDLESFTPYKSVISGSSDKVAFAGATLFLESGTTIRIYLQAAEGVDVSELDIYVDGVVTKATLYNAAYGYYYVEIENISAKNLADFHEVSVDGTTLNYAALSYCYSIFSTQDTQSTELLNVCRALYAYYEAAYAYENNK